MIIDCHCHIFNKSCTPFRGMVENRFRELLYGSAFDYQDKDNFLFILTHLVQYYDELKISKLSMEEILGRLLDSSNVDIIVPLMMNFDHGHKKHAPKTPFKEQLKTMIHLTLTARGKIMPFFAFDPRADFHKQDPISSARKAIEEQGFVGIKLYPPLGYLPSDDSDPKINQSLEQLYTFCCFDQQGNHRESPIPITVHCSWCAGAYSTQSIPGISNTTEHYRRYAHPEHWAKVLKKFPTLKLNLAHFGGLGEWEALLRERTPNQEWIDLICDLIRENTNVYTDLSFHGLPTTIHAVPYAKLLGQKINGIEDKILLGSDWYISRAQCSLPKYWQGFQKILSPRRFDMMTSGNAITFLQSDATQTFFPNFFARHQMEIKSSCLLPFQVNRDH
jgi:predicted TIM-barrel fold metal-dependent hydrolase